MLSLELDEVGLGQADVGYGEDGPLLDEEVLHHPEGHDARPLLGREFQNATVREGALVGRLELEEHGIVHLQSCQYVERRRREEDFVSLLRGVVRHIHSTSRYSSRATRESMRRVEIDTISMTSLGAKNG